LKSEIEMAGDMITLHFEKISRFDRISEPCSVAVPLAEGVLKQADSVAVCDGSKALPTQCRPTARWGDGSIKWLLVHFLADLPGNAGKDFQLRMDRAAGKADTSATVRLEGGSCVMETGALAAELAVAGKLGIFRGVRGDGFAFAGEQFAPLTIVDSGGRSWRGEVGSGGWEIIENGPVRVVVQTSGKHRREDGQGWLDYTLRLYAFAGKSWLRADYQVLNREEAPAEIAEMKLSIRPGASDVTKVRTALGRSNYRTRIVHGDEGQRQEHLIDAQYLIYESNEQVPETLYGTYWADWNDPARGGLCATIFQAQQNFPKALAVDGAGLDVSLVPAGAFPLKLAVGMAKTHRLFLHFHGPAASLEDLNVRSLQFQLPDRPVIPSDAYRQADLFPDIWVERPVRRVEARLLNLADNRNRAYGMLHWGDGIDAGYTAQGRGKGEPVWTNNEYDLPHQAMLMYARCGERRIMDYLLTAAEHWMNVDVCHCSPDPLRHQGHISHSAGHVSGGVSISHEWVEGLLDYYHVTGEAFALRTALGTGENILRHLQRPEMNTPGEASARETGWALRSLVALYQETGEEKWLAPAERIVAQFRAWRDRYGAWLSPYTDHTLIRVPFMIAIAAVSLTAYYRLRPEKFLGEMIVSAVRDLLDNCLMPEGSFYYKELPSLRQRGAGAHVIEAVACAYEVSGDVSLLQRCMSVFEEALGGAGVGGGLVGGSKYAVGDAVILPGGPGPKAFAAAFPAIMAFYRAADKAGLLK
jgi:hypothetical protein